MDWLGDIGGIKEILFNIIGFVFAGYLNTAGDITTMLDLYSNDNEGECLNASHEHEL